MFVRFEAEESPQTISWCKCKEMQAGQVSSYNDDLAFTLKFLQMCITAVLDRVDAESEDDAPADMSNDVLKTHSALPKQVKSCYTTRSKLVARFSGHHDISTCLAVNQHGLWGEIRAAACGSVDGSCAWRLTLVPTRVPVGLEGSFTAHFSRFLKAGRSAVFQRVPRLGTLGRVEFVDTNEAECLSNGGVY